MIKKLLIFSIACVSAGLTFGQLPVFSKSVATYSHLTGTTAVAKDSIWDILEDLPMPMQKIPLGFSFKIFGNTIDTFLIRDGAVTFNFGSSDTVIYIGSVQDYNDFCDKGRGTGTAKSPISWKRDGSAGSYIVKIQWRNFGFYEDWNKNGSCTDSGNMQLWIYQAEKKIELRFGQSSIANFAKTFPDKAAFWCAKYDQFGKTSGLVLDGNQGNPGTASYADTTTRGLTSWPTNGTLYTFTFTATGATKNFADAGGYFYSAGTLYNKTGVSGADVNLFSVDGKRIGGGIVTDGKWSLPTVGPGIYFARIAAIDGERMLRFVVE